MKCVVCRVRAASVSVDQQVVGQIDHGLLVYAGFFGSDGQPQIDWMAKKLPALRVFSDDTGRMNLSVQHVRGSILLIPNFTLAGATRKGTRPSFTAAAAPEIATDLFDQFASQVAEQVDTKTGVFGANMIIDAQFNGPVTVIVESPEP